MAAVVFLVVLAIVAFFYYGFPLKEFPLLLIGLVLVFAPSLKELRATRDDSSRDVPVDAESDVGVPQARHSDRR